MTWMHNGCERTNWNRARRRTRTPRTELSLVPVVVRPESPRRVLSRLEVEFGDGTRLQATGVCPGRLGARD